jgi:hypothetical protein
LSAIEKVARLTSEISSSARMIPRPPPSFGTGMGVAAELPASDSDNPAAAPSTGAALPKRLRFVDGLACDTAKKPFRTGDT